MQTGWIKLHRKILENPIYSNANMLKLWVHCLLKASHAERDQLIGNQMIKIQPGEFVCGRNSLEEEFNKGVKKDEVVSGRTLWRWMKSFETWEMLSIKSTTKYSVISIINWSEHQQTDQQVSNKRPTDVQQLSTNKNVKNVKKENTVPQTDVFDRWWNLYGKKEGVAKCRTKFASLLKKYPEEQIFKGTQRYLDHRKDLMARGEFCPNQKNPLTFLNGEHFNDEYGTPAAAPVQHAPFVPNWNAGED